MDWSQINKSDAFQQHFRKHGYANLADISFILCSVTAIFSELLLKYVVFCKLTVIRVKLQSK
jgi:hypothetical protein